VTAKKKLVFAILAILVGSRCPTAWARGFYFYAHPYLDNKQRPALMVTAEVGYRHLVFLKRDRFYEARYRVFLKIMDQRKRVVETAVLKKKVVVGSYRETRSRKKSSKVARSFPLPPGRYLVEAVLRVEDTQIVERKSVAVEVKDYLATGLGLNKPRLFAMAAPGTAGVYLTMNPQLDEETEEMEGTAFADFEKQPAALFELYRRDARRDSARCLLYFQVLDASKRQVLYGRRSFRLIGPKTTFLLTFAVDDWEPGSYKLDVRATLEDGEKTAATSLRFTVEFSRAMLGKYFDRTLAIPSLIADPEEIDSLREAPLSERPRLWSEFWRKRDPTPGTEANEALEEHQRRVRYAIAHFSSVEPGWKTDRGKIYIKYGEPDQVETTYDPYLQGEYQIWRYYERNMVFVFYDRYGLGDFRLVEARGL